MPKRYSRPQLRNNSRNPTTLPWVNSRTRPNQSRLSRAASQGATQTPTSGRLAPGPQLRNNSRSPTTLPWVNSRTRPNQSRLSRAASQGATPTLTSGRLAPGRHPPFNRISKIEYNIFWKRCVIGNLAYKSFYAEHYLLYFLLCHTFSTGKFRPYCALCALCSGQAFPLVLALCVVERSAFGRNCKCWKHFEMNQYVFFRSNM
jgi:hypothetical protein